MSHRRLRVLQVGKYYPPYMGGIETHLEALSLELREHVDVRVAVANDGFRRTYEVRDGVPVTRVGTFFRLAHAPVCPGLLTEIHRAGADIVHIHLPHPVALLALSASRHRGPLVLTYHSDVVRQSGWARLFRPILQSALTRSAAIVATSARYVESSPVLSMHREKCRVIPYGIRLEDWQQPPRAAVSRLRAEFGERIVLAVGRLTYYKGFEFLVRAMRDIDGRLLVIGQGPYRETLERVARESGVDGRVMFLGEIQNQDIRPYYHAADVFVLPSVARSEAFGIVQLEAMACGTPVVNTMLPSGVPSVSVDGITGLTVPPADAGALSAAINALLANPDQRAAYGAAGRDRVEREFSVEVMAERVRALYDEVVSGDR